MDLVKWRLPVSYAYGLPVELGRVMDEKRDWDKHGASGPMALGLGGWACDREGTGWGQETQGAFAMGWVVYMGMCGSAHLKKRLLALFPVM